MIIFDFLNNEAYTNLKFLEHLDFNYNNIKTLPSKMSLLINLK